MAPHIPLTVALLFLFLILNVSRLARDSFPSRLPLTAFPLLDLGQYHEKHGSGQQSIVTMPPTKLALQEGKITREAANHAVMSWLFGKRQEGEQQQQEQQQQQQQQQQEQEQQREQSSRRPVTTAVTAAAAGTTVPTVVPSLTPKPATESSDLVSESGSESGSGSTSSILDGISSVDSLPPSGGNAALTGFTSSPTLNAAPTRSIPVPTFTPALHSPAAASAGSSAVGKASVSKEADDKSRIPDRPSPTLPSSDINFSSSNIPSITAVAELSSSSNTSSGGNSDVNASDGRGGLSAAAEHVLIAVGAIGVFVVLCGIVYALHRFKKVDFLSRFGNRELRRGKYGIYGWRSKGQTLPSDAVDAFSRDDDEALNEKGWLGPSFGSIRKPDAAVMSVKDKTSWQDPRWPNPLQSSPPSYSSIFPGAHQTYRQSDIVSPLSELATSNSSMNMLVGNSPPLSLQYDHEKETMEPTYQSFATQATQNRYDQSGDTQENNRASNLSSLSSGFGDRLTLSDGSSGRARQSSAALGSVRDTLSTTVSGVSSRAGYRTINSWVGYQAGQLLGAQGESAVPAVPRVPSMLQPQQQQQLDGQSSSASSIVSRATSTTDPVAKMAYSDEKEVASLR